MTADAVIYEVRLRIDADAIADFDPWLRSHVERMLALEGFESAETIIAEPPDDTSVLRIVRYRLASRAHLDRYLETQAALMRAEGLGRFGNRFSATREIYPATPAATALSSHRCQNCDAPMAGQYCAICGQRYDHRIISLWELFRDVIGDVFELDSRVWRTLIPLLLRPGWLTVEYLRGRRVRYTPPFRLYLATSLAFFVVALFGSGDFGSNLSIGDDLPGFEGDGEAIPTQPGAPPQEDAAAPGTLTPETADQTESPSDNPCAAIEIGDSGWEHLLERSARAACEEERAQNGPAAQGETPAAPIREGCANIDIGAGRWQQALEIRARRACERLTSDGGVQRFVADLGDNLPGMMFLFLPVIALVMKLLYPLSRRFYVEHLLFFLHFHAFFFLLATATLLISRIPQAIPGQDAAATLAWLGSVFYIPVYLFIAQRRVYGQGRGLTLFKYLLLLAAYFFSLLLLVVLVMLFTALAL